MRYIRRMATIVASIMLPIFAAPLARADDACLLGFAAGKAADQLSLEERFAAELNAGNLREWMRKMTLRPHHAGSPYGKEVAEFIAEKFREWGFDTEIEVFHVLFPTPKVRILELLDTEETGQIVLTAPKDADVRLRGDRLPRWRIRAGEVCA